MRKKAHIKCKLFKSYLKMIQIDVSIVYTEPPEISVLSDEDSGAEDDDGNINGLSGRQLRPAVEIQQRNNVRINSNIINQVKDYDIDTQEPLVKEKQTNFVWASGGLQNGDKNFIPPDFSDFVDSTYTCGIV
ncbi:hypothetical protein NQ318_004659 [Aromia moschata]|uniref:Uncharacterized protein n=1 Tax=Aromia moschata TaxID=1265417 RepID=A0AAV8Y7F3_9CUCU|nr:hypothetical protein NQ318_004659 [Aromia moschata]